MALRNFTSSKYMPKSVAELERKYGRGQEPSPVFGITTLESPPTQPGDDLSLLQRLALLNMMNSTLARGVARKIASSEGVQAKPSIVDYHELRTRGLATKPTGEQFHELTFKGSNVAKDMLAKLCRDLEIHIMQEHRFAGETEYRCSCGGWARSYRGNGQFTWRRATSAFLSHYNPQARGVEY